MKKQLLTLISILVIGLNANALFELRAGYGILNPDTDSGVSLDTVTGFNLDAIAELPTLPVGLGIRYENLGADYAISGVNVGEIDYTRLSLLVNYRFIDLFFYFGGIGTIGISNNLTQTVIGFSDIEYDSGLTYSVGLEGGVSLGLISLGAELGYLMGTLEGDGNNEFDLDTVYAKAIVGVGF